MNYAELTEATSKYRGNVYKATPQLMYSEITHANMAVGVKTLSISGEVLTLGSTEAKHVIVVFEGVQFSRYKKLGYVRYNLGGNEGWIKKPALTQNNVMMRCSCQDYRFRFQHANALVKVLFGRRKKYKRVEGSTRKPVNPDHIPGYCKHIHNFVSVVVGKGIVSE
jgi:hypothetical protein